MPSIPSNPAPHRRRSAGIRRPRVAGRVPAGGRDESASGAGPREDVRPGDSSVDTLAPLHDDRGPAVDTAVDPAVDAPDGPRGDTLVDGPAPVGDSAVDLQKAPAIDEEDGDTAVEDGARPTGKRLLGRRDRSRPADTRTRRSVPTAVLAGALVVLVALAVVFGVANASLRGTPSAQNTALVDIGTTAQVAQQVSDDLKTVFSYDYARLDQNEAAARAVITPDFTTQYNQLFGQVRQLAPQQQAVLTATVQSVAVREITGDRAVLVVFLDQQATRAKPGNQPAQVAASGRLTVSAQLVDGTWKLSDVQAK